MSASARGNVEFDHFLAAQDGGAFQAALAEITEGSKTSHWMWFIFPQLAGLGSSEISRRFGLPDRAAAQRYGAHDELGSRLYEATEAMLEWAGTLRAAEILGEMDAFKFRSAMTLFEGACADDNAAFTAAIEQFFNGERCAFTLAKL